MKVITVTEPTSREYIKIWCDERGVDFTGIDSYIHPPEDAFAFSKNQPIFAVADGVTMLEYIYDESGGFKKKIEYPHDSAAAKAARIFCESSISVLESGQTIREAFEISNRDIRKMNETEGRWPSKDYFWNYPGSTVGIVAKIEDRELSYGFIADCGLSVIGSSGEIKFQTASDLGGGKLCSKEWLEQNGFSWSNKVEYIRLLQQECINHPERRIGDCPAGYGHLNGSPGAPGYLVEGKISIDAGDTIVLYSDGFIKHFENENFRRAVVDGDEARIRERDKELVASDPKTYGSERTLVAFRP